MTVKGSKPQEQESDRIRYDLQYLIESARNQPGVKDLMDVYENWKTFESVNQQHQRMMGVKRIITASNSSVKQSLDE